MSRYYGYCEEAADVFAHAVLANGVHIIPLARRRLEARLRFAERELRTDRDGEPVTGDAVERATRFAAATNREHALAEVRSRLLASLRA